MNSFSSIRYLILFVSSFNLCYCQRNSYNRNRYSDSDEGEIGKFLGFSKVGTDKSFKRYSYNRVSSSPCRKKDENGRFFWNVNVYNVYEGGAGPCGVYGDSINGAVQSDYYRPQRRPLGFFSNFLSLFIPGGALNPTGGIPPSHSGISNDEYRPTITTTTTNRPGILNDENDSSSTSTIANNNNYNRPTNRPVVVANDQYYRPTNNNYRPQQNYYRPQQNYYRPQQNYYRPQQNYYRPQQSYRPPSNSNYQTTGSSGYQPPYRPPISNNLSPSSVSNSGYYRPPTTTTTERPQEPMFPNSSGSNNFGSGGSSNTGNTSPSNGHLINADRPVVESFDDEPAPPYKPFGPGQLVGGLTQSVNGVIQSFTGETLIPGRGFFARLFF